MTTIVYKDRKIASDGRSTFGNRIDTGNTKKVHKINNCLVGGAGRWATIIQFCDWFEDWSNAQVVQGEAPHVQVFIPEGIDDEDFIGLVVFPDETIFVYEGGKKSYELEGTNYYAIGSGSDFALAALDAGATVEEAIQVAMKRDVFSGGEMFIEVLDDELPEFTKETAEKMTKEELMKFIFPTEEENSSELIWNGDYITLTKSGEVEIKYLVKGKEKVFSLNLKNNPYTLGDTEDYSKVIKEITKVEIEKLLKDIGADPANKEETKKDLFGFIIADLQQMYITP